MSEYNKAIDDCVKILQKATHYYCENHTPYRGACVDCGNIHNPKIIGNPDKVIYTVLNLKKE